MARNIVLTGLMGSGKSTIAQILSERLGFKLVDTDELIEYREKKSISHIFALLLIFLSPLSLLKLYF